MDYRSIITIEPGKLNGKPCIRGLRITVYDVFGMFAAGMSHSEILADFPYLTEDDIKACLAYAADSDRRLLIRPEKQFGLNALSDHQTLEIWNPPTFSIFGIFALSPYLTCPFPASMMNFPIFKPLKNGIFPFPPLDGPPQRLEATHAVGT